MKICSRIAGKAKNRAARKRTPVDLGKAVKLGRSTQEFGILLILSSRQSDFWDDSVHSLDHYDEYGYGIEWIFLGNSTTF